LDKDAAGHEKVGGAAENTLSTVPQIGNNPGRPIANRPQVDNLPYVACECFHALP